MNQINKIVKSCKNCDLRNECRDSAVSWIFLFIGIMAAIAMRLVVLLMHVNQFYAKAAWYTGISFFLVFFLYRYNISRFRAEGIEKNDLIVKMNQDKGLTKEDRKIVSNILCSLTSKKERINFAAIFTLSGIALAMAVIADVLGLIR